LTRNVLVIEDDFDLSRLVKLHLSDIGCEVDCIADGRRGLEKAESHRYGLLILDLDLDLGLPGLGGIEICTQLRRQERYVPILMLTAKSTELDRVFGLESGADDYLTKPFSILELVARVKAIFRRAEALESSQRPPPPRPLQLGGLEIDPDRHVVLLDDQTVELTAREFELLNHFAQNPGRVFNRAQLLDQVWGYGHEGYEHTVNSHINRLRSKIETDPKDPRFILTVWGVGYKFNDTLQTQDCASR
jgi:two-component system OmpR family response regulator